MEDIDIEDFFEIQKCVQWIKDNGFQRVCLQFPDELISYSTAISKLIESYTQQTNYVLFDNTYGSCCIDEKTSQHISGDSIIHFGHTCLSATTRIPVLFIFTKSKLNLNEVEELFRKTFTFEDRIVIFFDVVYDHLSNEFIEHVKTDYPNLFLSTPILPKDKSDKQMEVNLINRHLPPDFTTEINQYKVFFIGHSNTLSNLIINFPNFQFFIYDPLLKNLVEKKSEMMKFLMKRNFCIEKLRDANTIGILVGTLAVENYLEIIEKLRQLIESAGKTVYVVSIGEINSPKLANFPDIEVFVLVSCPESIIFEKRDFFQTMTTPYEVERAFGKNLTPINYFTDFRFLLKNEGGEKSEGEVNLEDKDVSLIRNRLQDTSLTWQGLTNDPAPTPEILEGKSGLPSYYVNEPVEPK